MMDVSSPSSMANLRDLGGLRTRDGRVVRSGRLFRSELPLNRTQLSAALELRTVVDLRRREEIQRQQCEWPSLVAWRSTPVVAGSATPWKASYEHYFDGGVPGLLGAIEALTEVDGQPALFHCASGKDRTGVVAAMLLSLLGVVSEDIVEDYVRTGAGLSAVLNRLRLLPEYSEALTGWVIEDHLPHEERMHELLAWLDSQGGVEAWLLDRGFDASKLPRFRDAMLVDGEGGA